MPASIGEFEKATVDDVVGLGHDPVDQFLTGGNVMYQACHHAAAPGAGIHFAFGQDARINACHFRGDIFKCDIPAPVPYPPLTLPTNRDVET